jgi:hypothetical protein
VPPTKLNSAAPDVETVARKSHAVNTQSVVPALTTKLLGVLVNVPLKPRKVTDAQPERVSIGWVPLSVIGPRASNSTGLAAP